MQKILRDFFKFLVHPKILSKVPLRILLEVVSDVFPRVLPKVPRQIHNEVNLGILQNVTPEIFAKDSRIFFASSANKSISISSETFMKKAFFRGS